jgi:WW domain-binding protein 4
MAEKVRGGSHRCEVCNCWVSPHGGAIRMHEQSDGHKEKLAEKLKQARFKAQQVERDKEQAERSMGAIEAAAQKAYAADVAAAARPEDALFAPVVVSAGARARQAEEAARRELESAVDVELKRRQEETYRAASSCAPPVWVFDAALGYHRDGNNSGWLYHPGTQQFYCPATQAWGAVGPGGAGGDAEEEEYPLNPFSSGGGAAHAQEPPRPSAPAATMPRPPPAAAPPPASSLPSAAMLPRSVPRAPAADGRSGITAFQLGFGTNHPAYEAARAKTGAAQARVLAAAGGSVMAVHGGPRGLGTVPAAAPGVAKQAADAAVAASKRKAQQSGGAAVESEALARREAARKRMEERTKGMFGLT